MSAGGGVVADLSANPVAAPPALPGRRPVGPPRSPPPSANPVAITLTELAAIPVATRRPTGWHSAGLNRVPPRRPTLRPRRK
ncbi:hypothetical protein M2271_002089 [Streptomyces sp. LBL]|nr:hypothetical protein [Streptomyces sp. LBL]